MNPRPGLCLALALLAGLGSGCSSFDRHWDATACSPTASRWEGRWTSEKHRTSKGDPVGGRLLAVIEPAGNQALTSHFHANWMIFSNDYRLTLEPTAPETRGTGALKYRGTHELTKLFGGIYRYDADLSGDRFAARYTSTYDHGTFALQRVKMSKDCFSPHAGH
jgi:hypothetical protein